MLTVIETLLPIILTVALGAALVRIKLYDQTFLKGLDTFVYWVAIPALFLATLSRTEVTLGDAGRLATVLLLVVIGTMAAGWVLAKLLRLPGRTAGPFIQAAFRGNLAYGGLAAVYYAALGWEKAGLVELQGMTADGVVSLAMVSLVPLVIVYNVAAVVALVGPQLQGGVGATRQLIWPIVTNPIIVSCVLGMGMSLLGLQLPDVVQEATLRVGQTAPPLALVSLGGALVGLQVRGAMVGVLLASLVKLGLTPLLTWFVAEWMGLNVMETRIAMIFAACPSATVSYVMASKLGADGPFAAACVVVSTILSAVALGVVLALV